MSKAKALERYQELPLPDTTEEHWRFTDLKGFDPDAFTDGAGYVEEARKELEAKDVEFIGETYDSSVCHMAFAKDPDGNVVILHRRYAPRVPR